MSADQVTPVTDNEREMQSGGACGLHGVYVGRRCPRCAQISEVEGTVPSAWYLDMKRERDRLVAALSAATTERDEALAQVGAATTILAEAEKIIPGIITTAGRFSIGLNDRERALAGAGRAVAAEQALKQTREALTDEIAMAEQSVEKLRNLRANWQSIIEEEIEGEPLIENILYWLIEDVTPSDEARSLSRPPTVQETERWPCGCVKGETPHGAGWADCEFAVRPAAGGAADKPTLNEPESKLKPLIGPGPSEGGCDDSANAKRPSAPGSLGAAADRPGSEPA